MNNTILAQACLALAVATSLQVQANDEPIQLIEPVKQINPAQVELGKKLYFDPRLSKIGLYFV